MLAKRSPRASTFDYVSSTTLSSAICRRLAVQTTIHNGGVPRTTQRLKKLANTLAALTRNAKRHDAPSYAKAIHEWENDLLFLYEKYYIRHFSFEWPSADFQS
jgi:hypothetical protein